MITTKNASVVPHSLRPLVLATLAVSVMGTPSWAAVDQSEQPTNVENGTQIAVVNSSSYILGPGDQVQLTMFNQDKLFPTPYLVLVDGTISLPFIGSVPVAGRSIGAVETELNSRYSQYYKRPLVTVSLVKPRTLNLAISGEVRRPGTYPINNPEEIPTVTQLIQLAGGTTQAADLSKVQVRRSDGEQSINLLKLLTEGAINENIDLRDGDTVVIPAADSLDFNDSDLIASASFSAAASEPLNIAVVGEVYRPGPHTIRPGSSRINQAGELGQSTGGITGREFPTVTQAIQTAGGIKPDADVRKVQVRRRSRTGSEQLIDVDLWKLLKEGDLKQDIALQQGDTVVIPKAVGLTAEEQITLSASSFSPATIDVNVVGEVTSPGVVKVPPNTPLNTAMLAAGGFINSRAKKSAVQLIRLNPDGTVSERNIKINFDQPVNDETNPALRNNDVVIVNRSGLTAFSDTFRSILSPVTGAAGLFNIFRLF
ncbi:MAG: SLBB domain-containing protein [Thermosynechococcaceae cyanobacterium]